MSRIAGIAISNWDLYTCIQDGLNFVDGKDYRDAGECMGELVSLVLDA